MTDALAPLLDLPGVRESADRARDALAAVHRHPSNRHEWAKSATEASWRAGRSSAAIDGGSVELRRDGDLDDPILSGAMRVASALDGPSLTAMVGVWTRAPLQALAKLHVLAAADMTTDHDLLGRPRAGQDIAARLDLLGQLVAGATTVPAPVLAGVVHGELLALNAFGSADGVVARAASRLVCASSGLDPHNLGVPEVTWLKQGVRYRESSRRFAGGDVGDWLLLSCEALEAGAAEALSIAEAAAG